MRSQDGTSIAEALVAALLFALVAGVVAATVVGPLRALQRAADPDPRLRELEVAAEVFARVGRAVRRPADGPAVVSLGPEELVVRVGAGTAAGSVRFASVEGALVLETSPATAAALGLPTGPLATGLSSEGERFLAFGAGGERIVGPGTTDVRAIGIVLLADEHRVERLVRLRLARADHGVDRW